MGGNVRILDKAASKIDLREISRQQFINQIMSMFNTMNEEFKGMFGDYIWSYDVLNSAEVFNGSSSYVLSTKFTDEEILKHKPVIGDIDITVPEELKTSLWHYLRSKEAQLISNIKYVGSNKPSVQSTGEQINTLFELNGKCFQVDFEFLPYKNNQPTEWSKFSHSSSFLDAKNNIKAVNHKYLIRALVGAASTRKDIIIATKASTKDNIRISQDKEHNPPRMLKFSVVRGVRVAYEPLCKKDGSWIYKEIPSKTSTYETELRTIFKLTFQTPEVPENELQEFNSFIGVVNLMKKYLTIDQIQRTHDRYITLLWGTKEDRAQELEYKNPDLDKEIKELGYNYLVSNLGLEDESEKYINEYYKEYGRRER